MNTFSQQLKGRFAALGLITLVLLGVLLARLWSMQVLSESVYAKAANDNRIRRISLDAPRGRIFDTNRHALVTNRPVTAVTIAASVLTREDSQAVLARVSTLIDVSVPDIVKKIKITKEERLKPRVLRVDVPMDKVSRLVERAPDLPGVQVEPAAVRMYPKATLAAHVLGYTGEISETELKDEPVSADYRLGDIVGKSGIEKQYDAILRGVRGYQTLEVDSREKIRGEVERGEPKAGNDIVLTLDSDVQAVAEKALREAIAEAHAPAGAAVVLDTKTGGVVAMASEPTFDPGDFLNGIPTKEWERLNKKENNFPLMNRAIAGEYAPASTFKAVTGMAAMQNGITGAWTLYTCTPQWVKLGKDYAKKCWDKAGHGAISFTQGIVQSCDEVFYDLGEKFWERYRDHKQEPLQQFARSMGLGEDTGIDLPWERSGVVPDAAWRWRVNRTAPQYRYWQPGYTVDIAIGQGDLLVTPLQLASVYAAFANGGKVMQPHLLQAILGADGNPSREVTSVVSHDPKLKPENLTTLRQALVGVTESAKGTGNSAFAGFPVHVAGKTGTAQVQGKKDYAWFAGFAPAVPRANERQYAIVVVVEQGGHGGSVAAPAARQILSKIFNVPWHTIHATDVSD